MESTVSCFIGTSAIHAIVLNYSSMVIPSKENNPIPWAVLWKTG